MPSVPPELGLSLSELTAFLSEVGLANTAEVPTLERLSGGVSSAIFKIELDSGVYCIKKPLDRLRVDKDWMVPVDRVFSEVDWLELANRIAPGHTPCVLGFSREFGIYVMEYLDNSVYANWKESLMGGTVDKSVARQVADVLVRVHSATAGRTDVAAQFSNHGNFYLLRLEPYLIESARIHPDLATNLVALVHDLQTRRLALLHGDVSPKNILVGRRGVILIDAECACFGDPSFDIAFLLNHFLLKSVVRPDAAIRLMGVIDEVCDAYFSCVDWESEKETEERVASILPALLLARVDGRSPVEYLSERQRSFVRSAARCLLQKQPAKIAEILEFWEATRSRLSN